MNTMELVHWNTQRARPRDETSHTLGPLFYSELRGPTRHAILRGRQFLLSEQRGDGSWLGLQTVDASLPSQLILLLAYEGREQSELAQQAAITILDQQQPSGGWSLAPNAPADVSTSVQAYFALKLTGIEPSDERLQRARHVIRKLGGADAADSETRFFLALLGQIGFDHCAALSPEAIIWNDADAESLPPLSLIWAHRPVREVGVERGVRELFKIRPDRWPRHNMMRAKSNSRGLSAIFRAAFGAACHKSEQHGWTPLRRWALDRAESRLLAQLDPVRIRGLGFQELLWHRVALHAIGYAEDRCEVQACEDRLRELIPIDEDRDCALPQIRTTPFADTLLALDALQTSGLRLDHPAVASAAEYLSKTRRNEPDAACDSLAKVLHLLSGLSAAASQTDDALLPDIGLRRLPWEQQDAEASIDRRLNGVRRAMSSLIDRLRQMQNDDGGWNSVEGRTASMPATTATVLEAIATAGGGRLKEAVNRAVAFLRKSQQADGSWADADDCAAIHSTSLAVYGLVAAGVPCDDDAIAAGVNWLRVQQHPSGGWLESVDDCIDSPPSATHTAWALAALVAAGQSNGAAALRAVNFLRETQRADGKWQEPHFVLRDTLTGRRYANELHTTAWPLIALSQWAVAATASQSHSSRPFSLRLIGTPACD